jgi:hypothetical protein
MNMCPVWKASSGHNHEPGLHQWKGSHVGMVLLCHSSDLGCYNFRYFVTWALALPSPFTSVRITPGRAPCTAHGAGNADDAKYPVAVLLASILDDDGSVHNLHALQNGPVGVYYQPKRPTLHAVLPSCTHPHGLAPCLEVLCTMHAWRIIQHYLHPSAT